MKRTLFPLLLILACAPSLSAQDAKSFGLAGCGTATVVDAFAVHWNPAALAVRGQHIRNAAPSAGFSASDSTNIGMPVLDYTGHKAALAGTDPVRRVTLYQGLFAVQHRGYALGVLQEDACHLEANQSALDLIEARRTGTLSAGDSFMPDRSERRVKARHVLLGAGKSVPLGGSIPFFAVGGSIKYTLGTLNEETLTRGSFVAGTSDGLVSSHFRADRGKGISYDAGIMAKLSSSFQAGCVWENVNSKVTWDGVIETLRHDPSTGSPEVASVLEEEWTIALPRAVRVGLVLMPEGKDIQLIAESRHTERKTRWRFALERSYPRQKASVRLGLLKDPATDKTDVTLGGGWFTRKLDVNAALLTRKFPAVLNSQSVGGALSATYIF